MTAPREQVRRMFGRIAGRYDLVNDLISLAQHRRWKRLAAQACRLSPGGRVLDVCAGTADIALAAAAHGARAVALDFSPEMVAIGVAKARGKPVAFVRGDALDLPFRDGSFDAAAVGFSLRNVASVPQLLREMRRVVRPGGRVVSLETSQPRCRAVRALYHLYLRCAVSLAPLVSEGPAYRYLAGTIFAFAGSEEIAALFRAAGLRDVGFTALALGAVALHVGRV